MRRGIGTISARREADFRYFITPPDIVLTNYVVLSTIDLEDHPRRTDFRRELESYRLQSFGRQENTSNFKLKIMMLVNFIKMEEFKISKMK